MRLLLLAFLSLVSCDLKQWVRDAGIRMKEAKRRQAAELEAEQSQKAVPEALSRVMELISGSAAKVGGAALVGAAAFVAGQRVVALISGRSQANQPRRLPPTPSATRPPAEREIREVREVHEVREVIISRANSTEELLSAAVEIGPDDQVTASRVSSGRPVVLLFDCNDKLNAAADISARKEYFSLMSNLTDNGQDFIAVYVPSSLDNSNPHVIEKNSTFRPKWRYISASSEGRRFSNALRSKFDVKEEELRILLLDRNLQVVYENAIELLRVSPFSMPWNPVGVRDMVGTSFLTPEAGAAEPVELDFNDQVIGLYFSASWCKPCQVAHCDEFLTPI